LPNVLVSMDNIDRRPSRLDLPLRPQPPRPSGIALWRPDIVLAERLPSTIGSPAVVVAEPRLRPEAIRARLEATQSVLASAAEAEQTLRARVAAAEARAQAANSERERVTAVMEAYRVTAALETALGLTVRRAHALLGERGVR
jgi:hypothetical protein